MWLIDGFCYLQPRQGGEAVLLSYGKRFCHCLSVYAGYFRRTQGSAAKRHTCLLCGSKTGLGDAAAPRGLQQPRTHRRRLRASPRRRSTVTRPRSRNGPGARPRPPCSLNCVPLQHGTPGGVSPQDKHRLVPRRPAGPGHWWRDCIPPHDR